MAPVMLDHTGRRPVAGLHHFVGHEITVVLDVRPKPPIRRLNERWGDSCVREIRGMIGRLKWNPSLYVATRASNIASSVVPVPGIFSPR
jgi:hypothetical protein